jgi:co-chaperonin GroES (HSP10)
MKAIGQYIVISEIKEDLKETEGGLLLAENHREDIRYRTAVVNSIGTHVKGIEEKDTIYYDRFAGHNIEINNIVYKVIQEQDVIIVL